MTRPVISGIAPFLLGATLQPLSPFIATSSASMLSAKNPTMISFLRSFAATVRCSWSSESQ